MPRGSARCNVKVLFLLLARRAFKNKKKMQTLIGEKVDFSDIDTLSLAFIKEQHTCNRISCNGNFICSRQLIYRINIYSSFIHM